MKTKTMLDYFLIIFFFQNSLVCCSFHIGLPEEFGYMVTLRDSNNIGHFCTGAIIGHKHVLTAAHCLQSKNISNDKILVNGGPSNMESNLNSTYIKIRRVFISRDRNVRILKLRKRFDLKDPYISRISIISNNNHKNNCIVVGWNQTQSGMVHVYKFINFEDFYKQNISGEHIICDGYLTAIQFNGTGEYRPLQNYSRWIYSKLQGSKFINKTNVDIPLVDIIFFAIVLTLYLMKDIITRLLELFRQKSLAQIKQKLSVIPLLHSTEQKIRWVIQWPVQIMQESIMSIVEVNRFSDHRDRKLLKRDPEEEFIELSKNSEDVEREQFKINSMNEILKIVKLSGLNADEVSKLCTKLVKLDLPTARNKNVQMPNKNDDDETPLHYAALHGKIEAVKFLIDRGENPRCLDKTGLTCLHFSSIGGHLNTIEHFLQYYDVDVLGDNGKTPLHHAALHGKFEAVKFLIDRGANPTRLDNTGLTCLHFSSIGGHLNTTQYFLQYYDVNVKNAIDRTPLHYAAQYGKIEAVKFLIYKGANPKCSENTGVTCLHFSSIGGHLKTIKYFLQYYDVNVKNCDDKTPLHYAAQYGKIEAVKFLIGKGANPTCLDNAGLTCLHFSSIGGHVNTIEYFLRYYDVEVLDDNGKTPLHYAAQYGKIDAVQFLIYRGANPTRLDKDGSSCLHYAAFGGTINTIEYFLQYYDVNVKDNLGKTPLLYAAESGKKEAVNFLISKQADTECLDNNKFRFANYK